VSSRLGLHPGGYFLATFHRAENVDIRPRLAKLVAAFAQLGPRYGKPVVVSTHPRTRARLQEFGLTDSGDVRYLEPMGFFDFVRLEREAFCVISDSGTVQEECALFGVPNLTIRDTTERPETLECGSNMLSGVDERHILDGVEAVTTLGRAWEPPPEYRALSVSDTIAKIVLGYLAPPR
jgi:UDP-N-acetylglucosamine 2-epimerase (non-hydrolysing)